MADKPKLKKELTLISVYALATGATLSSGFFLLPGLAYESAGPAMILSYLIAAIPLIPATFSIVELGSAMPRAGGAYYFLDRTMGPLVGTVGGLGTWLTLTLKTAFALIGMGAYLQYYLPEVPGVPADRLVVFIAAGLAIAFALFNLRGTKRAGSLQVWLVAGLILIVLVFIGGGVPRIDPNHFRPFFSHGGGSMVATAGLVYISYVGVTNVASISEEIKNPERNLPLGVFLAVGTAIIVYGLGTTVIVGVLHGEELAGNLRPIARAAEQIFEGWGGGLLTVAACLAFFAVANAGILSASRYPLAMSRDHLVPRVFRSLNSNHVPVNGVLATLGLMLFIIFVFDVEKIAKLASAFQLLLFGFLCLAVIFMRESGLHSYDPGYRSPFYPWMQLVGIAAPIWLIANMGAVTWAFAAGLIVIGVAWYLLYARRRVSRVGAIFHVFERLGRRRQADLDRELRDIMKEKGARQHDPFDDVIIHADILNFDEDTTFEQITAEASAILADRVDIPAGDLSNGFLQGTRIGATPVAHGAALPHLRLHDIKQPYMVIARSKPGVRIDVESPLIDDPGPQSRVHALFYLVSPEHDASLHLRILAQLARHLDDETFMESWVIATNDQQLKELLLRDERHIAINLAADSPAASFIGNALRDIDLPAGCLVALINREGDTVVPNGNTILETDDRLTIIGDQEGVKSLYETFQPASQP
jgi:amino acid transporter/mannitol/fructose-specific phosphotransferase system IIA component (Ntr-type)